MSEKIDRCNRDFFVQVGSLRIYQLYELSLLLSYRSMSAVAEQLGISQGTLSKHFSAIERVVGVKLFNREYRLSLTSAGVVLAEYSLNILSDFERSVRICRNAALCGIDELRIEDDGTFFLGKSLCDLLIQTYLSEHQDITLRRIPATTPSIKKTLKKNIADAGFWYDFGDVEKIIEERKKEDLGLIHLVSERMVVWARKDHPVMSMKTITAHDISQYSIMSARTLGRVHSYNVQEALFKTKPFERCFLCEDVRLITQFSDFLALDPGGSVYILPESQISGSSISFREDMQWRVIDDAPMSQMFFAYEYGTKHEIVADLAQFIKENINQVNSA